MSSGLGPKRKPFFKKDASPLFAAECCEEGEDATAENIAFDNVASGLTAVTVQQALDEIDGNLDAHIADTTDAHNASAISYDPTTSGLLATQVQAAIDETVSNLNAHILDLAEAHDATAIAYNPATSGLTAVETQAAIDEIVAGVGVFDNGISNAGGTIFAGMFPLSASPQALAGPGAVNITDYSTNFTSTGTGDALTLVDGAIAGQLKKINYVAEGAGADTGILTPGNLAGFATITFNAVGDSVLLMFSGTVWAVIEASGVTLA